MNLIEKDMNQLKLFSKSIAGVEITVAVALVMLRFKYVMSEQGC